MQIESFYKNQVASETDKQMKKSGCNIGTFTTFDDKYSPIENIGWPKLESFPPHM